MADLSAWDPLDAATEALNGDDDVIDLFTDPVARGVLREARFLYRDGQTPDATIADMLAPFREMDPIPLH